MMMQNPNLGSHLILRNTPRRMFNSKIDSFLEQICSKLPQNNIIALIIALNALFYGAYVFWPKHQMHSYLNSFTFSLYGLNHGYFYNLITCHFSHQSFLTVLIDSLLLGLLSQSLIYTQGPLFLAKTVLLSMSIGSLFLFLYHNALKGQARPFQGNDAILRGIIFSLIFTNPQQSFMLFPLPIQIPAWAVALVLLGFDFMSMNVAGFGGVTSGYMMIHYFI